MSAQIPQAIARYQIIRSLGEGGMGSVYLAKDPVIDRFVAIKLLRTGFDDESMRERFRREAKAVGQLHHINIVTIFDVGEHDGDPFIAMEYVEGQTLAQVIRSGTEVPLASAITWMEGLCAGLHYAHKRGIIHRDIKPANLVVDDESKVKILDFGIARGPASGMTQVGMLMGTLNYMSPEQLSGKTVDHRSDIFAVGGVFYELLAGRQAFPGDINSGVLHKILMAHPDPVKQLNPAIPDEIGAIIERCLSKDAAGRYADLEAMRKDLVRARAAHEGFAPEATIRMQRGAGVVGPRAGRTPGDKTRAELMRQRHERIAQHISRAREALAARELAVAADACNQALILDPENAEAFELQEQVERFEQAQQWLGEAQNELARGALTAATQLMDRVAGLDANVPDAPAVREKIAAERRRREEIQRRARALEDALARARTALESDRLDVARAAVNDAIAIEKDHAGAAALLAAIATRAAEKKRAEDDARARAAIATATERFAAGDHDAAIALLKNHTPAHPLVDESRSSLEFERREILRREAEERARVEAKRREDEQRRRDEERRKREDEDRAREEKKRQAELEKKRQAEEEKKRRADEERRQAEEEKKRQAEEQRRRVEAERTAAADRERQAAERKATEARARRDAEKKAAEQAAAARAAQPPEDNDKTIVMFPAAVLPPAVAPAAPTVAAAPAPAAAPPVVAPAAAPLPAPPKASPGPPPPASLTAVSAGAGDVAMRRPPAFPGTSEGLQPAARWPSQRALLAAIGAAAVLVIGLIWYFSSGRPLPPPASASVLIDIRPWAAIESIVLKTDNQPVDAPCPATPCVLSLPAGEYHLRARNPFFPNAIEFDVVVTGSDYQEVRKMLPDLNAEEEARRILGGR